MCICSKAFVFKSISSQLDILVGCNLSFTKSLSTAYIEMNGLCCVDWTPSKILPPLFHLTRFKIITVVRPSRLLRVFFMGGSEFAAKGGNGEGCPHSCPKFWTSHFSWMSLSTRKLSPPPFIHALTCPSLDCRPHIGKRL